MAKKLGCCKSVFPINAARPFRKHAEVLKRARVKDALQAIRGGHILEIGAGALRNALFLQAQGFRVTVIEMPGIEERFPDQYQKFRRAGGRVFFAFEKPMACDLAIATFVFETICVPRDRIALIGKIQACLKRGAALVTSTRGPADLVTATASGIPCSDGFLTPGKTFSRSFTRQQFLRLLKLGGFPHIEFLHAPKTKAPEYLHAIAWAEKEP